MKHASIASDGKKGSDASVAIRCGQLAANSAANANIRYGCDNRPGIYYSCRAVREHEINSSSRSSVGVGGEHWGSRGLSVSVPARQPRLASAVAIGATAVTRRDSRL